MSGQGLKAGDRVRISGGYEMEPRWLEDGGAREGTLVRFIPGQNARPAAVVRLDNALTVDGRRGDFLVLELRHAGAAWQPGASVHLELLGEEPEDLRWQDRKQGTWIEAAATITALT